MSLKRKSQFVLSGAALLVFAHSAYALDGNDVLSKINAAYAKQGGATIVAQSVDTSGSNVTLKGATLQLADKANSLNLGDIAMSGVVEAGNGGYTIEKVNFPDVSTSNNDGSLSWTNIEIDGVSVPGATDGNGLDSILFWKTAHTGPLSVKTKGVETVSMSGIDMTLNRRDANAGLDFNGALKDIKLDLTQADDPKSKDVIEKLDLQHVNGQVNIKGGWTVQSGTIDVSSLDFNFDKIGDLDIALSLSGYTMDFIKSVQEAMKASESNPNKEEAQQALGLAMLGLAQQLTFDSARINFKDGSITKRLLDYFGQQQGVTGKQLADSLKGMVPMMMAQLQLPELQNEVSAAVSTYLDNPQSLTVSAQPAKPVAFPMIMGAAMGAPKTIPNLIGLKVSADN